MYNEGCQKQKALNIYLVLQYKNKGTTEMKATNVKLVASLNYKPQLTCGNGSLELKLSKILQKLLQPSSYATENASNVSKQ